MPTGPHRPPQRPLQRRVIYTGANRFDFDKTKIPPDMEYGWKVQRVGGLEATEQQILTEQNGWEPVPAERHPELAGSRAAPGSPIIRGDQMLMQIPKEWAQEARDLDKFDARNALEEQIARLGMDARREGAKGIRRDDYPTRVTMGEPIE